MKKQRRLFLQALTVGSLVPALFSQQGNAAPFSPTVSERTKAVIIDVDACQGCGVCVDACRSQRLAHLPVPQQPIPRSLFSWIVPRDWSKKREEKQRLTPYNWLFIQQCTVDWQGKPYKCSLPRRCLHCLNPQCVTQCPTGSMCQEPTGATHAQRAFCLGAGRCPRACPWFFPRVQSGIGAYLNLAPRILGNGLSLKCDFCWERLSQGEAPYCVQVCPHHAQFFGSWHEMAQRVRKMAEERQGDIFGLTENGGTSLFYVSKIPFREIEAALLRQQGVGAGKPSLRPATISMEKEKAEMSSLVIAPALGIGLATLRLWRNRLRKKNHDPR